MSEGMTAEQCRASQRECSRRVDDNIQALRKEVKDDIGLIREAVQMIDRSVAQIRGYLGLNGITPTEPHPHKRPEDDVTHLHRRLDDVLKALQDNTAGRAEAGKQEPNDGLTLPRWAVIGLAGFVMVVLAIAMLAGERGLQVLPKGTPATTTSHEHKVPAP